MRFERYFPRENEKHTALDQRVATILFRLGLPVEEIRGKKIVDIGAGARSLAAYCLKEGISKEVYSVEPYLDHPKFGFRNRFNADWPELAADIDSKTVKGDARSLPFADDSFDIAVSHAAIPLSFKLLSEGKIENARTQLSQFFGETTRVLKPGGRAYVCPIAHEFDEGIERVRADLILEASSRLKEDGYTIEIEKVPEKRRDPKSDKLIPTFSKRMIITKPTKNYA